MSIYAALVTDIEGARRTLRELLHETAGDLALAARLTSTTRMGVWRALKRSRLLGELQVARERAEQMGWRRHRRGFGTTGWKHGYEGRLDLAAAP